MPASAAREDFASNDLIVFRGVTFRYPRLEAPALRDVDLRIGRGEYVGIVGPTGAGKSTFCQALNGIVPQFFGGSFTGSITVAGQDTVDTPTHVLARRVGMVLEDPEIQITAATVEGEVAFALENQGVPTVEIRRRVDEALAAVGLEGRQRKHPAHLSGGQKQRLAIASALALRPDIIVLDEPTSQLDPVAATETFELLRRLNESDGITVVVASHATEELAEHTGRILLLSDGRIVEDGPPELVLAGTDRLTRHSVRPPDITQSFEVLHRAWPKDAPQPPPVTLAAARRAGPDLARRLSSLTPQEARRPERPREGAPALEAEGLTHVYPDGTRAIEKVDLAIKRGGFTAIVGRNGSGKSTLIRHFLKLLEPTGGAVRVHGEPIAPFSVSELAGRIGYVAQNADQQIFCDSVAEEVGFALRMRKRPKPEVDVAVGGALEAMGLSDARERHPLSLSRGDRLRVVVAAVLALRPSILVFDEPTTGQDWRGALAILDILKALNAQGATVLVITHHLYLLPDYAERLVVMNGGRVLREGPLREVLYDAKALDEAGLKPPQTVRFAEDFESLKALRPLGARDLERIVAPATGEAA